MSFAGPSVHAVDDDGRIVGSLLGRDLSPNGFATTAIREIGTDAMA